MYSSYSSIRAITQNSARLVLIYRSPFFSHNRCRVFPRADPHMSATSTAAVRRVFSLQVLQLVVVAALTFATSTNLWYRDRWLLHSCLIFSAVLCRGRGPRRGRAQRDASDRPRGFPSRRRAACDVERKGRNRPRGETVPPNRHAAVRPAHAHPRHRRRRVCRVAPRRRPHEARPRSRRRR